MNDNFLSGLLGSIQSGARSSMDAFEQDVGRVSEGRMPDHAMALLSQMLGAYSLGTGLKQTIPANSLTRKVFDSKKGWGTAPMDNPSVDPVISLLMHAQPGSVRDMMLQALRAQNKSGTRTF